MWNVGASIIFVIGSYALIKQEKLRQPRGEFKALFSKETASTAQVYPGSILAAQMAPQAYQERFLNTEPGVTHVLWVWSKNPKRRGKKYAVSNSVLWPEALMLPVPCRILQGPETIKNRIFTT